MRILICSYEFHPVVGGTETAGMTLACGLAARGHQVTVATTTPAPAQVDAGLPFAVVRRPAPLQMLKLFHDAELVWHNEISLRQLWPVLAVRRPLVFVHHCSLDEPTSDTVPARFGRFKRTACLLGSNAFVSEAVRKLIDLSGPVIYNGYDERTFHAWPDVPRDRDVVFLGRLSRIKGADILLDSLALLAAQGTPLCATIVGSGPQEPALKSQASALGLDGRLDFTVALRGQALSRVLARHRVMAMPTRGFEALGISAIESLACGCVVVGSDCGGVREVIGPCGMVVPSGSAPELAAALGRLCTDQDLYESLRARIAQHLELFSNEAVMDRCEALIHRAARAAPALAA